MEVYRHFKYEELFQGMITKKENEQQENDPQSRQVHSHDDSYNDNNTSELTLSKECSEGVQNQLILSESQKIVTKIVADIENSESDNTNPQQKKLKTDIFAQQINQSWFKLGGVRALSNNKKVSSDCLLQNR